jgi:hypothetical protein
MSFASVRTDLATAITDNAKWQTFAYPPDSPTANSVIITPGSPWVQPLTVGNKAVTVAYRIKVCVNTADNQGELTKLEDFVTDILDLLPSWTIFKSVSAPQELQVGTAYLTVSDIDLEVAVSF